MVIGGVVGFFAGSIVGGFLGSTIAKATSSNSKEDYTLEEIDAQIVEAQSKLKDLENQYDALG